MDLKNKLLAEYNSMNDVEFGKYTRKLLRDIIAKDEEEKRQKEELLLKQKNCKHENTRDEISEWHPNGDPDRWRTYCKDCGKLISS